MLFKCIFGICNFVEFGKFVQRTLNQLYSLIRRTVSSLVIDNQYFLHVRPKFNFLLEDVVCFHATNIRDATHVVFVTNKGSANILRE